MKKIINLCSILIFLFFSLCLPLYNYLANKEIVVIRNIIYFICCIATFIVLANYFHKLKFNHPFVFSLIILLSWNLFYLLISYYHYNLDDSQSDMIAITYFLFALALGIQLKDLADKKYFLFVTFAVWLIICLIIYSSTNFMYFQAFYGKYNEDFSGSYQLIGDTFAFVSILLLCRLATLVHTQKESKKIPIKNNILSYEAIIFVSINLTTITSIIFLFLNSSRASFYSSLPVFFYINYCFFSRIKAKRIYMFISILIVSIIISLLLFNTSFLSYIDFSFLIYNRNLEFITTNNSTSLAGRKNVFIIGFQDIMYSPIIGNYVDRMIDRGKGSYIHNIFGMLQDFGMPAFLSYLCLIIYCMRYFLHSWKSTNYYMNMLFNSIFIFSIVELFVFRYPLGFYLIFVVFGLVLKLTSVSKHIY